MVVNFRACGISRGARKLVRTPTLIKKKKNFGYHFHKIKKKISGILNLWYKIKKNQLIKKLRESK